MRFELCFQLIINLANYLEKSNEINVFVFYLEY